MSDQYLGEIRNFGFSYAPQGWAQCNGQLMAISQNAALFSLLGTFYGGNGTTTFQLPDLRGRVPLNQGNGRGLSPYVIGELAGGQTETLLTSEMPQHSHSVSDNQASDSATALSTFPSNDSRSPSNIYNTTTDGSQMNPRMLSITGSSQPHNNMQPYLATNYCIALVGIYPSRS
jgi:microcystin-dependent protein